MKKILLCIIVLSAFITHTSALEFENYMKFTTGAWWMKSYRFYNDTSFLVKEYPFPTNSGDFLTYGSFGLKAKGDKYEAIIEMGIRKTMYDSYMSMDNKDHFYKKASSAPYLKKWFCNIFINDYISVLAGQDYALSCFDASNQAFLGRNSFNNIGCLYTGRYPMIKFDFHHPDQIWKFQAAVLKVDTANLRIAGLYNEDYNHVDTVRYVSEVIMPKIEGSFELNIEAGIFGLTEKFVAGFQQHKQAGYNKDYFKDGAEKHKVNSFVIGNDFRLKLWIFNFAVDVFYGQNLVQYGAYIGDAFGWWFTDKYMLVFTPYTNDDTTNNDYLNSKVFEYAGIFNVKPTDWLHFEVGAGQVIGDHDFKGYQEQWNPTFAWYFQAGFKIFDKIEFTPEIGQYDYGPKDGFGKYFYWGIDTYIDF